MDDKPRNRRPTGKGRPGPGGRKDPGAQDAEERVLTRLAEEGMLSESGRRRLERVKAVGPQRPAGEPAGPGKAAVPGTGGGRPGPRATARQTAKRTVPGVSRAKAASEGPVAPQRLQKVMAQAGVASRRHSEELIQAGRVTVNGKVVSELGSKVTPGRDLVEVDGRPLGAAEQLIHIILNKPKGYVTTLYDPQGRAKVTDLLGGDIAERVYPVGRLDYDTEGLLLLTNDGELANALMHPSKQIMKTYVARVRGVVNQTKLTDLSKGIQLDDGPTAPAEAKLIDAMGPNMSVVSLRIHEGRNRQVRRMFDAIGHEVISLRRTTLGPLNLHALAVGEWRELSEREVADLRRSVGLRLPRDLSGTPETRAPRRGGQAAPRPAAGRRARTFRQADAAVPDVGQAGQGARTSGPALRAGRPQRASASDKVAPQSIKGGPVPRGEGGPVERAQGRGPRARPSVRKKQRFAKDKSK